MYAEVVPLLRTPIGVDYFDYQLPQAIGVTVGDLVVIPFRRRHIIGLVSRLKERSDYPAEAKSIIKLYQRLQAPASAIDLLRQTAEITFCSQPTVLKSWLRLLPKKNPTLTVKKIPPPERLNPCVIETWALQPGQQLSQRARQFLATGQKILILTPWIHRCRWYQQALADSQVLHSQLTMTQASRAWSAFIAGSARCLITTRLGSWLAPWADAVLVDEPENDDYKQDELSPRYDVRQQLNYLVANHRLHVETFGLSPRLNSSSSAPTIALNLLIHIRHPQGKSAIPGLQADSLQRIQDHHGPITILHPIRGLQARFVCRDCGWRAACPRCGFGLSYEKNNAQCRQCGSRAPLPTSCAGCGGSDLSRSWPGIEKLQLLWKKQFPAIDLNWRNLSVEDMDKPYPANSLVIVTDGSSLSGAAEDVRRHERQCLNYRRLASRVAQAQGTLIVQTDETSASRWLSWLTSDGYQRFRQLELEQRQLFGYPPANRLIKVLIEGDAAKANAWLEIAQPRLPTDTIVRGPFPVSFRSKSRSPRMVVQLINDGEITDHDWVERLTPTAKSAIIDLYPVAFLK